jgi:uncharacterized membrane protein YoaK (UPF0700 family)
MFRHKGKNRTFIHNLRLAALLSFIAGMVNISGVLSIKTLTTNVTGHFAFFAEDLVDKNYAAAFVFLIYILSFLIGAFISNFLIETVSRIKPRVSHAVPMMIEVLLLAVVGLSLLPDSDGRVIACVLLLAMGIQNSLVTQISESRVRTTHLTGLFTDLGIELSQLFFYRQLPENKKLSRSIYLKLIIIGFFFLGGIMGGFMYKVFALKTLLFAAGCLLVALFYDNIRYRIYIYKRKFRSQ